jgi:hypothetical protein
VAALAKFLGHNVRKDREIHKIAAQVKLFAWVIDDYRVVSRQWRCAAPAATTPVAS